MGISRVGKMWSWMRYERFTYYVFFFCVIVYKLSKFIYRI